MRITGLNPKKILSSFGNETLELSLVLENGISARIQIPAGISAGKYEAHILPADHAIVELQSIENTLMSTDWTQESLDSQLTTFQLAGNTSLAVSAAFWKATNVVVNPPTYSRFPKLLLLLFEGAKHGNPAITMQEFMLLESSLNAAIDDFKLLRSYLGSNNIEATVGAEGGFSPLNFNNFLVLEIIQKVFPGRPLGIDAAGSFKSDDVQYGDIIAKHNIAYLEDPFSDEDWDKFVALNSKYGDKLLVVGDDLTTTNPDRLQKAIDLKAINAVIIKPNQNGTVTGTINTIKLARAHNLKIIVSHRGEETDDDWIVDFALHNEADFVKFGGMDRGERVAKYNRLLELGMK